MITRDTLEPTRALGQMRKSFFNHCLKARLLDGPDKIVGDAYEVFEGDALQRLSKAISIEAMHTPIVLTENLSNRLIAGLLIMQTYSCIIAVNVRFKIDAETLLHAMAEEFAHAQQVIDGVDFQAQRQQFAYAERPYEIHAKAMATAILGYEPENCVPILWRNEPLTGLYDVRP